MIARRYRPCADPFSTQLEFKYLSHLTGKKIYWQKVEKVGCSLA